MINIKFVFSRTQTLNFITESPSMKIQIISDLHQEFGISELCFDNADLVIFAGDTNLGTKGIEWIKTKIKKYSCDLYSWKS